jgi:hypothetical protein
MKMNFKITKLILALACLSVAESGWATDAALDFTLPSAALSQPATRSIILAENAAPAAVETQTAAPTPAESVQSPTKKPVEEYDAPFYSGGHLHQYLGIATLLAAGMTGVTHPEGCEDSSCVANTKREMNGPHAQWAKTTIALATATVAAGLLTHWDDFSLEDGLTDPDNLHVLLGAVGAGMMAYAVQKSLETDTGTVSHAGIANAGAVGMLLAIKLTW